MREKRFWRSFWIRVISLTVTLTGGLLLATPVNLEATKKKSAMVDRRCQDHTNKGCLVHVCCEWYGPENEFGGCETEITCGVE